MPVYNKLYISQMSINKNPFYIKLVFNCPNCGTKFNPQYQPTGIEADWHIKRKVGKGI